MRTALLLIAISIEDLSTSITGKTILTNDWIIRFFVVLLLIFMMMDIIEFLKN